jgi:hypothetical protein
MSVLPTVAIEREAMLAQPVENRCAIAKKIDYTAAFKAC